MTNILPKLKTKILNITLAVLLAFAQPVTVFAVEGEAEASPPAATTETTPTTTDNTENTPPPAGTTQSEPVETTPEQTPPPASSETTKEEEETQPAPEPTQPKVQSTNNEEVQKDSTSSVQTLKKDPNHKDSARTTESYSSTRESEEDEYDEESSSKSFIELVQNAIVNNNLNSDAASGDANANDNDGNGTALSGDATVIANLLNLLQASWNIGGDMMTFIANIMGAHFGDLLLNLGNLNGGQGLGGTSTDLEVNVTNNANINNDVNLNALSGNATANDNDDDGTATSGDAHAIANIVNAINSAIAAQQSFLGMLNIYGSLNGDILLPPGALDQLFASNGLTTFDTEQLQNSELLAEFTDNQAIANNVNQNAASGAATANDNDDDGTATSGAATNNLTVLNLTGRQVIGKNALLVFVNVHGKWVGMIVDAPGSTAAALGGGITSNNGFPMTGTNSTDVNVTNNLGITNNLNLNAASGNANANDNDGNGTATSGDATTSVNLLNITGSQLSFADWFGILFINVFGTWNGSFGMDTAAGGFSTKASTPPNGGAGGRGGGNGGGSPGASDVRVFRLGSGNGGKMAVMPMSGSASDGLVEGATTSYGSEDEADDENAIAATSSARSGGSNNYASSTAQPDESNVLGSMTTWLPAAGVVFGAAAFGVRHLLTRGRMTV